MLSRTLTAITIAVLMAAPAAAIDNRYTEDFTSELFKDALNTEVHWDTGSGELKLFEFLLQPVGGYDTNGSANGLALHGDFVFVADSYQGLKVIDISDPAVPSLAGSYYLAAAEDVVIVGNHAYVAAYNLGLMVFDITTPTSPALIGSAPTTGQVKDLAAMGDSLYVAGGLAGLHVFDISTPGSPVSTGTYSSTNAQSVTVSGRHLFVGDHDAGLLIFDVTGAPTPVGSYDTPGSARSVDVEGNYAYVADGVAGLQIIDIADPSLPVPTGGSPTPASAQEVVVTGDWAYLAVSGSGIQVLDVSDPATPVLVSAYDTSGYAMAVLPAGDLVHVGDGLAGLAILAAAEVVAPPTPAHVYATVDDAVACAIEGNHLYVCLSNGATTRAVEIVDVSDPENPIQAAVYTTNLNPHRIVVDGGYAYVAEYFSGTSTVGGIEIIDVSDPTNPTQAFLSGVFPAGALEVDGGYVYATLGSFLDGTPYFYVFDAADPTSMTTLGWLLLEGWGYALAVAGDLVYLADATGNFRCIDVSDPTSPVLLASTAGASAVGDLELAGDHLFAASGFSGLQVWDVTSPTMSLVGTLAGLGEVRDVEIVGDQAFVCGGLEIHVVDIADPTSPTLVDSYLPSPPVGLGAFDVVAGGDHLYAAYERDGLHVLRGFWRSFKDWLTRGQSLMVHQPADTIIRARVSAVANDSILWNLSSDGGSTWQPVAPDEWSLVTLPPGDLLWRSDHRLVQPDVNPSCSSLEIEWLHDHALIDSIVDVPGDQGGVARLHFTRSGRDFTDAPAHPAAAYDVYRRVDQAALAARVRDADRLNGGRAAARGPAAPAEVEENAATEGAPGVVRLGERSFVVGAAASEFPPGVWEAVATVHALQQPRYISLVPTLGDSSSSVPYSTFVIATHTTNPSVWYVSEPDSGYSVDNIAPGVPQGVAAHYQASGVSLDWDDAPEYDFQFYRVYRDLDPGFTPSPANLVHEVATSSWSDATADPWDYQYKVSAVDDAGNESPAAAPQAVSEVPHGETAARTELFEAVPNPFNPSTTLAFSLRAAGRARLRVYDAAGRLVATLADRHLEDGRYEFVWDGRDAGDRPAAAGVYLYRLEAGDHVETKRMVLLK